MSWADRLLTSLDERAAVIHTTRGEVQVATAGEGPPVVVSHGSPGGFDLALAWCRHLRDGGCTLLAPSRPGYLRTPLRSGASPEAQADLYAAMLDVLEIEQAAVMGFSAGAASAVHFAARYPHRTTALFLDAPILLPFEPPLRGLRRAILESGVFVWLAWHLVDRSPASMARFTIGGVAEGLTAEQRRAELRWITSDPDRLRSLQEQFAAIAPRRHRAAGAANDEANERQLAPLPFADVEAPTLIAHGTNDAIVPLDHALEASRRVAAAELILVEDGHHILSLSRNYGPVARRQLELALG